MDWESKFVVVGSVFLFNWLVFDALFGNRVVLNLVNLGLLVYVGWSLLKEREAVDIYLHMNIGDFYGIALFVYLMNLIFNRWMGMYLWLYTPVNVLIVAYTIWFTYSNRSLVRLYLELVWLRFQSTLGLR